MSKISKIVVRIFKWTFATILSIIIILVILGAIFQERVVSWIVKDLQSELAIPVQVESIKFSFIENFPNASAVLSNSIALYPGFKSKDTLLTIKRFYINLNIIALIQGEISIQSIDIKRATVTLKARPDGTLPRIQIFKKPSSNVSSAFNISSIDATNLVLIYINHADNNNHRLTIRECAFSGTVSERALNGRIKLSIRDLETNILRNGNVLCENAKIDITGNYSYGNNLTIDDFRYKSMYLSINGKYAVTLKEIVTGKFSFSVVVPNDKILKKIFNSNKFFSIRSINKATIDVTGNVFGPKMWDANFDAITTIADAKVTVLKDVELEIIYSKLNLKASLKNNILLPKAIAIESTTISHENKEIALSLSFIPWRHQLSAKINGDISPSVFSKVLNISSPSISGENIKLDASLYSNEFSIKHFNPDSLTVQGTIDLTNITIVSTNLSFTNISGSLGISDTLEFKHLSLDGSLGKLNLSGTIPHWRQSFLSAKNRLPLEISGNISSPDLNLNLPQWGLTDADETSKTKTKPEVDSTQSPLAISKIEVNFSAKKIALRQLRGTNARGTLVYLPNTSFSLINVSLTSLGGKAFFNLDNRLINNNNTITFSGKTYGIYVDSLFLTFNNFDQTFIGYEHLSGRIDADVNMKGVYENGQLLNSKLFCLTTLEITEGCLKNYEPLKKLSGFVNMKELEKINFKRLKNTIRIENNEIIIPEMLIENNALNINISGVHKLSGSFDYRMRIKLKDLLWSRNKSSNRFRSDLGIVEQEEADGGSLFVKLIGTPENYNFKYDKDRAIETLGKKLKQEGAALRNIFKQDINITKPKEVVKKNSGFVISDPLENKEKIQPKDTINPKPLKKNSGFKIDWE